MRMTLRLRQAALTAHVACSVGWLGAVAASLALAVAGLGHTDMELARAAYRSMDLVVWALIVPLSAASLSTGLLQALGTRWGLFRHYWVVVKLLLTLVVTIVLVVHTEPIGYMADAAGRGPVAGAEFHHLRWQIVGDAGAALLVLLGVTALSIVKPWGMTRYGRGDAGSGMPRCVATRPPTGTRPAPGSRQAQRPEWRSRHALRHRRELATSCPWRGTVSRSS